MATAREREKQRVRYENARRAVLATKQENLSPGDFVSPAVLRPGEVVVGAVRVSSDKQKSNGDLEDQKAFLQYFVDKSGGVLLHTVCHVGDGRDVGWFGEPCSLAKQNHAAVLVESVCRIVRPEAYSQKNQKVAYDSSDLRKAKGVIDSYGVGVYSVLDPEAPYEKVRRHQIERGVHAKQAEKGNPPGYRKRHRARWLPRALELRGQGLGYVRIARVIQYESGIPLSSLGVRNWLLEEENTLEKAIGKTG